MTTDQQRAEEALTDAERLVKGAATRTGGVLGRLLARTREEAEDIWAEAQRISRPRSAPQPMAASVRSGATAVEPICWLPLLGATTVEDGIFYTAVGAVSVFGVVSWPTAALMGTGHALHQRARNVIRTGKVGAAREGLIEAFEDVV